MASGMLISSEQPDGVRIEGELWPDGHVTISSVLAPRDYGFEVIPLTINNLEEWHARLQSAHQSLINQVRVRWEERERRRIMSYAQD